MLKISTTNLQSGMIIGRSIFNADGFMLLGEGVALTNTYIKRLEEWGIASVYIRLAEFGQLEEPDEIVSEKTRVNSIKKMQEVLLKVKLLERIDILEVKTVAQNIIQDILNNRNTLFHLGDIRRYDDYTFSHSVNVAVLSVILGMTLGYNQDKLNELALGALLHDLGKTFVPKEILNKAGSLTEEEMNIMKQHSEYGFDILRKQPELSLLSAHIAFQHHERIDGTGYPRGLSMEGIHEYARIVAIADIYDALISDRPYSKAILPHVAYEILIASAGRHVDTRLLELFFKNIAIYPVGSIVKLNTGQIGMVSKVRSDLQLRPIVTILANNEENFLGKKFQVDLSQHLTVFIDKVFTEKEVLSMI